MSGLPSLHQTPTMSKRILLPHESNFYGRNLPHWQPENAVLFITCRLYGSLPKEKIQALKALKQAEKKRLLLAGLSKEALKAEFDKSNELYFGKFDQLLDNSKTGPHWLKEPIIAKIWSNALLYFDQSRYKVICSTIMSNHVHFIFYKLDRSLARIMKTMKGFSAREINKILNRTGENVWQEESFDRLIRDRIELAYRINYTLNNPVVAGLVGTWEDWPYSYIHPDFLKFVEDK